MVKIEDNLIKTAQNSVRYCGSCKREYNFNDFKVIYPIPHQDNAIKLWYNQQIQFYCSYCYLLKIIKKINKEKKLLA